MDKDIKQQLSDLFVKRDAKIEEIQRIKSEREEKEASFLSKFIEIRSNVIRPAFESFSEAVSSNVIDCCVSEEEEGCVDIQQRRSASIAIFFKIGKNQTLPLSEYPYFRVVCNKSSEKVSLYKSTMTPGRGGQSGPVGEFEIHELTEKTLHKQLVEILQGALL